MSGGVPHLAALLQAAGYRRPVTVEALAWAFETPETRPVLNAVCEALATRETLRTHEVKEFHVLETEGRVCRGNDLDVAVERTRQANDEDKEEELSKEIASLQERLRPAQARLARLVHWRDALASEQAALWMRAADVQAAEDGLRERDAALHDMLRSRNEEVNATMASLAEIFQQMACLHDPREDQTDTPLVSRALLEEYETEDDRFRMLVRQLQEHIFAVEGEDSSPPLGPLGEEVDRLMEALGAAKRQCVLADVELARAQAEKAKLESSCSTHNDTPEIASRDRVHELEEEINRLRLAHEEIQKTVVDPLAQQYAEGECSAVVLAGLQDELARRDVRTTNLAQLEAALRGNLTRHLLLSYALGQGLEMQRSAHRLLLASHQQVEGMLTRPDAIHRPTPDIQTREDTMERACRVLGISNKQEALSTWRTLKGQDLRGEGEDIPPRSQEALDALLADLATLRTALGRTSTEDSVPQVVRDASERLKSSHASLVESVLPALQDLTQKKDLIKRNLHHEQERRNVFVDFFLTPENLIQLESHLAQRVEARSVE